LAERLLSSLRPSILITTSDSRHVNVQRVETNVLYRHERRDEVLLKFAVVWLIAGPEHFGIGKR